MSLSGESALLDGVAPDAHVYFTHAYAAPVTNDCVATSEHGVTFAAAVERGYPEGRGYVGGVQFHPEKSSDTGLRILRNFLRMVYR